MYLNILTKNYQMTPKYLSIKSTVLVHTDLIELAACGGLSWW